MRIAVVTAWLALASGAAAAGGYDRSVLVPGAAGLAPGVSLHGVNGMAFGRDGKLYVGSVVGASIVRIDVARGAIEEAVAAPDGEADDVAVGPDGTLAWTALLSGEVRARRLTGEMKVLARDLPGINPIAFVGARLYAGQMPPADTLLALDVSGKTPPRVVGRDYGGINAFVDDLNGGLYIPMMTKGAIGRVDLATGQARTVADGLGQPAAVKRDAHGGLATIDWATGRIYYVNPDTGETKRLGVVDPPLDNLVIGPDDTIYVSRPSDNAIIALNPETGAQRVVTRSALAAPGGVAVVMQAGKPTLLVADLFGYRAVDGVNGTTESPIYDPVARNASAIAASDDVIAIANVRRGTVTAVERATGRVLWTHDKLGAPMGVAIDAGGRVLVSDYARGEIVALAPEPRAIATGLDGPVGLIADADGLWVSEAGAGTIARIDPATGARTPVAEGLARPEGFARLPGGRIAVAEVGARRLTLLGADGPVTLGDNLPVGAFFTRAPAPVFIPTGVAADPSGAIYMTCDIDNSVLKFTPRPD